jgi:hypothetical protein
MALDTYAWLPTIQPVKDYLEIEGDADVPTLERITNAATQAIERMLARKIISRSHVGIFDGNGYATFLLPQYPITAVASVYLGRNALGDGIAEDSTYYEWNEDEPEEGMLYLTTGASFPKGSRNVKITWTAGYVTKTPTGTPPPTYYIIPADLIELLLGFVKYLWKKRDAIGEERISESVGGATIQYATSFWTKERKAILSQYRALG